MPTPTYTPLATVTLGSSASSVTFSSIPTDGTYRDLVVVISAKNTTGNRDIQFRFNGDAGSNYYRVYMFGNGSTATSATDGANPAQRLGYARTDEFTTTITNIMDYSATDKHKTSLSRVGAAILGANATAGRWQNTAAINSMTFLMSAGQFTADSTFSLYGIAS